MRSCWDCRSTGCKPLSKNTLSGDISKRHKEPQRNRKRGIGYFVTAPKNRAPNPHAPRARLSGPRGPPPETPAPSATARRWTDARRLGNLRPALARIVEPGRAPVGESTEAADDSPIHRAALSRRGRAEGRQGVLGGIRRSRRFRRTPRSPCEDKFSEHLQRPRIRVDAALRCW